MRALEKIVQLARALGIVFLGLNSYWFCYDWFAHHALTTPVVDRIFWNLQQSTGLFTWSSITKFCALFFLVLGCYGTRSVRDGKPSKRQILLLALAGLFLLFGNDPLRSLPAGLEVRFWSYVLTLLGGYLALLTAGVWVRRLLHTTLARDPFNDDNESFEQEARLLENEYSVNLPTRYYYRGEWRPGMINVINPFRGRRRTNRAISVKLIYWLKLNVNNLKSAIWVKQRKITENIRKGMTSGWLGTSVGNYRFCFPEFPTNLRTLTGLNSIILSQFGMCK